MSTLVLASASGAPGVTTTALGLALSWPRDVVLLDADRAASHAVLAGYLSGQAPHGLGVHGLLQAHRERRSLAEALAENQLPLPGPPLDPRRPTVALRRGYVPGFTHLSAVDVFETVWSPLLDAIRGSDQDLLVDAGRVGHRGLPTDLVAGADAVVLVCRTSLAALAGVRLHLPPLVETGPAGRVGLLLVGPGRPYASQEVSQQFGIPVLAEIPWDPQGAADLAEPGAITRTWPRQPLGRALGRTASALLAGMTAHQPQGVPA